MANFVIDKSRFNADQLAQYEALVAIGKAEVDPAAAEREMEDDKPDFPAKKKTTEKAEVETMADTKKAAPEVPDFVADAIAKSEAFIERIEKKDMTEVAKKYAILGQDPEALGEQLYNLKKSDETMYNTCISMLDGQVALIEKSGLFTEIGKGSRGSGNAAGGAEAKADAKAKEIMKADPTIGYTAAIAKAWAENPELMAEYDAEYIGR